MNLDNRFCIHITWPKDSRIAQKYFANNFKNVTYDEGSDSFIYRGVPFDYFRSGLSFLKGAREPENDSFTLVDKEFPQIWVYSPSDSAWEQYLATKQDRMGPSKNKNKSKSIFQRFWDLWK